MLLPSDDWLPHAMARLSSLEPDRYESFVESFRAAMPEAYEQLVGLASEVMRADPDLAERAKGANLSTEVLATVRKDEHGVARIVDSHVAVWEVVRAFRRVGSVTELSEAYPGLSERELRTALAYGGTNPDEISGQIARYEDHSRMVREAYPQLAAVDRRDN